MSKLQEHGYSKKIRARKMDSAKIIYLTSVCAAIAMIIGFTVYINLPSQQEKENVNYIEQLAQHASLPDLEVTEKIRWLSWYEPDENSPTAQLFRERYGLDENQRIFEHINTSYAQRYEVLATMIASENSPDMFQFENKFFPWGVHQRLFEPVDDLFDFSAPEWDATRPYIDAHRWGGRDYTAITEIVNSTSLLYYRNSVIESHNLPDPYELWQSGNWTWDVFETMMAEFSNPEDDKWGIMGFYIDDAVIGTTGTPLIGINDGLLQSNLDHGNIERAASFMQKLALNDYRFPYHTLNNFIIDKNLLRSGGILFWNDGSWDYQYTIQEWLESDNIPFSDIGIVPFPRDPQSNTHYQRGKHDTMMLVNGAPNPDLFKAWVQCAVLTANSPEVQAEIRENMMSEHNWTEHHLNVLDEIRELPQLWEFRNGIGEDVSGYSWGSPVENLTKNVIYYGESYDVLREENRAIIEARIALINQRVMSFMNPNERLNGENIQQRFLPLMNPGTIELSGISRQHTYTSICFRYTNKLGYKTDLEVELYKTDYHMIEIIEEGTFYKLNSVDERRIADTMQIADAVIDFMLEEDANYDTQRNLMLLDYNQKYFKVIIKGSITNERRVAVTRGDDGLYYVGGVIY
jgi:multiple sugar transport system substrate-binding protein